jgi:hypothetical protein
VAGIAAREADGVAGKWRRNGFLSTKFARFAKEGRRSPAARAQGPLNAFAWIFLSGNRNRRYRTFMVLQRSRRFWHACEGLFEPGRRQKIWKRAPSVCTYV